MKQKLHQETLDARIRKLDAQIGRLTARAGRAEADMAIPYREQMQILSSKQQRAWTKQQLLRQAGEEASEDLKDGADRALADLQDAVAAAVARSH